MWIKMPECGLVNTDRVEYIDYKGGEIKAYLPSYSDAVCDGDSYIIIGDYVNAERAKEVIEEIGEAISTGSALYQMPDL